MRLMHDKYKVLVRYLKRPFSGGPTLQTGRIKLKFVLKKQSGVNLSQ